MDGIHQLLWRHGDFLGVDWGVWKVVGWVGNLLFTARFAVQWHATEKRRQVSVPVSFWWLSLAGAMVMLCYALFYKHDSVFIFAYAFTWIPYFRNLVVHYRHERAQRACPECGLASPPVANYCARCGAKFAPVAAEVPR